MAELTIARAQADDAVRLQRRRNAGQTALRLTAELAERGSVWAAADDGEAIGLAVAHACEDETLLGDVFVEPSFRGQGIGRRLISAAFDDAARARAIIFDTSDTPALAIGLRAGIVPRERLLEFAGAIPREETLASMAAGDYRFGVERIEPPAFAHAIDALDRQVRGTERSREHAFFARGTGGADGFFLNGELVAYAYVWPDGRIGPLAAASAAYLGQVFAYVLVTLVRRHRASWCTALVPASNVRIARAALRAGLRIERSWCLASDRDEAALERYVGFHRMMF